MLVPNMAQTATKSVAEGSFGHISLLPFVSMSGKVSPPSLCVQGSVYCKSWTTMWPEAEIRATPKGAMTGELFCQFCIRWERWVRESLDIPRPTELLLLLDSGGGSLIHLTPEFTIFCDAASVRPFFSRRMQRLLVVLSIKLPTWCANFAGMSYARRGMA